MTHLSLLLGWKSSLGGAKSELIKMELAKESVLTKSLLRNRTGFVNPLFNAYSETLDVAASEIVDNNHSNNDENEVEAEAVVDSIAEVQASDSDSEFEIFQTHNANKIVDSNIQTNSTFSEHLNNDLEKNNSEENLAPEEIVDNNEQNVDIYGSGDFILDGRECLEHIGVPNPRQVHNLGLRSAYESYSVSGEPLFTASWPVTQKNLQLLKNSTGIVALQTC